MKEIVKEENLQKYYYKRQKILLGKMEPIYMSQNYIIYIDSYMINNQIIPRITLAKKRSYDNIASTRIYNFVNAYKLYKIEIQRLEDILFKKEHQIAS